MVSKSTFKWGSNAGSKWPKILQISSNNHTQALNEKKSINYNIKHIIFPKNRENDPKIIYILSTYQLLCGSLQCTVLRMALIGQGQKSYGTKYLLRHAVHHNENSYRQVCLCSNHILMSIISYNVQGAKKLQVIQEIKFFTRTQRPDMILLLKTMVNEKNIKIILSLMGYDHFDYVLPNNHLGGLAVLWNEGNIHASVLIKEQRAIDMLVHDSKRSLNSVISGIYALAQSREKDGFLGHLVELNNVIDIPWCLVGDFNELANTNEKKGGQVMSNSKYHRLNNFLSAIDAESVQVNGNLFTWKKRREVETSHRADQEFINTNFVPKKN